jgi:methylated-DNA-[protein]-cysteine S-methyltransferase
LEENNKNSLSVALSINTMIRSMILKTSRCGTLRIDASPTAVVGVAFLQQGAAECSVPVVDATDPRNAVLLKCAQQLTEFDAGQRSSFDVPIEPSGTPFQVQVWSQLCQIPFGKTVSYKDIATSIGKPTAARAVGAAVGRNPIGVIVPCHRVISANGVDLIGFAGGLDVKKSLLALERVAA